MRNLFVIGLLALGGCDYSADFLFTGLVDGVDDVIVIEGTDGAFVVPAVIQSYDDIAANTIFTEVSASATAVLGGATLEFEGTGGSVCVWADPEMLYWSQSISSEVNQYGRQFTYPDNPFDDGDIDIAGGLSVFYTGSPGVEMGDFIVYHEDSLGNEVPISLVECLPPQSESLSGEYVTSGRGAAEFCTINGTQEGIAYTVALTAWSVPLDDDRLSFGVLLAEGDCGDLLDLTKAALGVTALADVDAQVQECVIMGEALTPDGDPGPFYGRPDDRVWPGSEEFELSFCNVGDAIRLDRFCKDEAAAIADEELICDWRAAEDPERRCYCGDPNDTPLPGAI